MPEPSPSGIPHARLGPVLALGALSLIWGYNWVVIKEALRYCGPFTFAALRTLLGGLGLFAGLAFARRSLSPGSLGGAAVLGLLQTTGFIGLVTWALVAGGPGKTAVLAYTMPFWLLLLSWPLLGEHLRGFQWPAAGLAFLGLILVLQPWSFHPRLGSTVLAILSGVSWALSAVWVKHLRSRRQVDLLPLTAWQLVLGAVPLLLVALLSEPRLPDWTAYFLGAVAYNALPATAIGWALWLYALQELPAGVAGMGTLLTPAVGVTAAWLQLGETPGPAEGLGMLAIFAGLALLGWERLRSPPESRP